MILDNVALITVYSIFALITPAICVPPLQSRYPRAACDQKATDKEHSEPSPPSHQALQDNIPDDFSLALHIDTTERRIQPLYFWHACLSTVVQIAQKNAFSEQAEGGFWLMTDVVDLVLLAKRHTTRYMLWSDVTWTVQRMAEQLYSNREYYPVTGIISAGTPERVEVGVVNFQSRQADASALDSSLVNTTDVSRMAKTVTPSTRSAPNTTTLIGAVDVSLNYAYQNRGQHFDADDIHLAIIHAIAELSPWPTGSSPPVDSYTLSNEQAHISIVFEKDERAPRRVTKLILIEVLEMIVDYMRSGDRYADLVTKIDLGKGRAKRRYGKVAIKKYQSSSVETS